MNKISAEFQFLNWSDSATSGGKVIFAVGPDDLEKFKQLTRKEGKKPGAVMMAVLVLVDDQGQPEPEKKPQSDAAREAWKQLGPLSQWAVMRCDEGLFQQWMSHEFTELWSGYFGHIPLNKRCKDIICKCCKIASRKELDTDERAAEIFHRRIREPYAAWLNEQG